MASERDVRTVAPLFDAYRIFYGQPGDLERAYRFLHERWALRESVVFFAEDDGHAVGFVQLYPSFTSVGTQRLWILNDLYVDANARRAGIGHALMQRAEAHARETGAHGLTLTTATDNVTAQALYEREGYVVDRQFLTYERTLS